MTDLNPIRPPSDCLYTHANAAIVTLAADPDGTLNFGLFIVAPSPLGCIRIRLDREDVITLRNQFNELAALNATQVAQLMATIRSEHYPNVNYREGGNT